MSVHPPLAFNPRPRRLSTLTDAYELHPQLTPNVRTGCISCTSGDGAHGGPIWWNTPITAEITGKMSKGGGKKRAAEDGIEDPEVRKRLAALKGADGLD